MTRFKPTFLLVALLMGLSFTSQGQEKWNINGKSNLAAFNVNFGNPIDFLSSGYIIFNYGGELQLRRIINKKWEAQVGIGFNRFNWRESEWNEPIDYYSLNSDPSSYQVLIQDNVGKYSDFMWNVSARYYRSGYGSFAPLGYYYKFGITGTSGSVKTPTYEETVNGVVTDGLVQGSIPVSYIGLILGYGREYAITDNLFFGFGGDILLGTTSVDLAGSDDNSESSRFAEAHTENLPFFIMSKNLFVSHYSLSYLF